MERSGRSAASGNWYKEWSAYERLAGSIRRIAILGFEHVMAIDGRHPF